MRTFYRLVAQLTGFLRRAKTYELEQWFLDGTRLAQAKRVAHWFDSSRPFSSGMLGEEPSPYVADLGVLHESIVEVIDVDTRRLQQSIRVPVVQRSAVFRRVSAGT